MRSRGGGEEQEKASAFFPSVLLVSPVFCVLVVTGNKRLTQINASFVVFPVLYCGVVAGGKKRERKKLLVS